MTLLKCALVIWFADLNQTLPRATGTERSGWMDGWMGGRRELIALHMHIYIKDGSCRRRLLLPRIPKLNPLPFAARQIKEAKPSGALRVLKITYTSSYEVKKKRIAAASYSWLLHSAPSHLIIECVGIFPPYLLLLSCLGSSNRQQVLSYYYREYIDSEKRKKKRKQFSQDFDSDKSQPTTEEPLMLIVIADHGDFLCCCMLLPAPRHYSSCVYFVIKHQSSSLYISTVHLSIADVFRAFCNSTSLDLYIYRPKRSGHRRTGIYKVKLLWGIFLFVVKTLNAFREGLHNLWLLKEPKRTFMHRKKDGNQITDSLKCQSFKA